MQKDSEYVFTKTIGPTFIFKAIDIHDPSCPSFFKLPNDPTKNYWVCIFCLAKRKYMVELCVGNYVTYDSPINEAADILKICTIWR